MVKVHGYVLVQELLNIMLLLLLVAVVNKINLLMLLLLAVSERVCNVLWLMLLLLLLDAAPLATNTTKIKVVVVCDSGWDGGGCGVGVVQSRLVDERGGREGVGDRGWRDGAVANALVHDARVELSGVVDLTRVAYRPRVYADRYRVALF
jgi:hypothetical protein